MRTPAHGGYYPMDKCRCTYRQIVKYQNRISGPILDRIDLFVRCEEIGYEALTSNSKEESSADIRKRVSKAWEIQKDVLHKVLHCLMAE